MFAVVTEGKVNATWASRPFGVLGERAFVFRCGFLVAFSIGLFLEMSGCAIQRGTIGARLGRDPEGHVFVREAPAGLGSAKAGLRAGDELLLISGQDVRALSEEELHSVLSGERGSRVRLTLQRGDEVLRVAVERTAPKQSTRSK